ncbi:phospholipase [Ceratobasidium sp. AG-Ba]|nr:phospholipase [Ceratobasidium sp. AG-Ba]
MKSLMLWTHCVIYEATLTRWFLHKSPLLLTKQSNLIFLPRTSCETCCRCWSRLRRSSLASRRGFVEVYSQKGISRGPESDRTRIRDWSNQEQLMEIMEANIELNHLEDRVRASVLDWGDELPSDLPDTVSLILAADCVYAEPAFPLLVSTLSDLSDKYGEPEILFCYKKRRKADKRFFGLLKKHFTWSEVDDDPDVNLYSREAITLLKLKRKQ